MLGNCAYRESGRAGIEPTNGFLKGRMQRSLSAVGGVGNTSNLPQFSCALHQATQGGATHSLCLCCLADCCSGLYRLDSSQVAQKAFPRRSIEDGSVKGGANADSASSSSPQLNSAQRKPDRRCPRSRREGDLEEWEGSQGERQIKGTNRVSWTFAKSTRRCPERQHRHIFSRRQLPVQPAATFS